MPERTIKYSEALREATEQLLAQDERVFVIGLGVPLGAGGTTNGLKEQFPDRVLDTPTSEAALTGLAVGASIQGLRPIVHHDRVEFSLFAADQMFTQAAKWRYMFGGEGGSAPITVRIIIGRQWGNGPQHSQALLGMFGGVTGLRVVIPSTPAMAKGLLVSAVRSDDPVIVLEPRWIYGVTQEVSEALYEVPLDKARVTHTGDTVTVVAYGDGYVDAVRARELIGEDAAAHIELIDLVSVKPIDYETIIASARKTGSLITVDTTSGAFSAGSEIIAKVALAGVPLRTPPIAVSAPDVPCPTTPALSEYWYPTRIDIANAMLRALGKEPLETSLTFEELHLAPTYTLQ